MKIFNKNSIVTALAVAFVFGLAGPMLALAAGPAAVNLGTAGNFVLLSKTGITDTGSHTSSIIGNIGSSPITAAAMNDVFCSEMAGTMYGVDAAYTGSGVTTCFAGNPPLSNKTLADNAVLDMQTAYADAAGRANPTATELGAGNIGGMTLAPGLYKWSTDVTIPTNVTLSGGSNDVWIFQIAGNLNIASSGSVPAGVKVVLSGGAQASNVFWQVGGVTGATLGTYSTFNGNILSAKQIIIQTGAVLNGRALAQTQITLDADTVTGGSGNPSSNNPTSNNPTSNSSSVSPPASAAFALPQASPTIGGVYNLSGACGTFSGAGSVQLTLNQNGNSYVLDNVNLSPTGTFSDNAVIPNTINTGPATLIAACSNGTTFSSAIILGEAAVNSFAFSSSPFPGVSTTVSGTCTNVSGNQNGTTAFAVLRNGGITNLSANNAMTNGSGYFSSSVYFPSSLGSDPATFVVTCPNGSTFSNVIMLGAANPTAPVGGVAAGTPPQNGPDYFVLAGILLVVVGLLGLLAVNRKNIYAYVRK
jgi:hypothetical protein